MKPNHCTAKLLSLSSSLLVLLTLSSSGPAHAQPAATAAKAQAHIANEKTVRTAISDALGKGDLALAQKLLISAAPKSQTAVGGFDGSVFYEAIKACGFYPQESRLACVIDIKQPVGYGGPVGSFGSFEYVHFCIDWDNDGAFTAGESVGSGIVHMHDEVIQAQPPWQYAVYRNIDPPGGLRTSNTGAMTNTTSNATTRKARAILSWSAAPTDCNYSPVWGNIIDFQIRLDPIR